MAVNQQLKDYIVQQTKLGVSRDAIKSALASAGWNEADITQAFSEIETAPPEIQPAKPSPMVKTVETQPVSFVTSDIFKAKGDSIFKPEASPSSVFPEKPKIVSVDGKGKRSLPGIPAKIVVGLIIVASVGGNAYLFLQNKSASSQIDSLNKINAGLQSDRGSVSKERDSLSSEVNSLNGTITELNNQLSIFAAQPTNSSSGIISFKVKGTVGVSKTQYFVTTPQSVVFYVKNSTDPAVSSALKLFVGKEIEIAGTHQAVSPQLIIVTIKGKSPAEAAGALQPPSPSSSTPSTYLQQTSSSTSQ